MAATRARRSSSRGPLKGRTAVALGLAVFVLVASAAVWRRSQGNATERAIEQMRLELRSLRAEQQNLENDLRRATSRRRVVEEAEQRLGMHVATESQTRLLVSESARLAPDTLRVVPP